MIDGLPKMQCCHHTSETLGGIWAVLHIPVVMANKVAKRIVIQKVGT